MKSYTEHINYTEFCPFGAAIPVGPLAMQISTLDGMSIYRSNRYLKIIGKKVYFFSVSSADPVGEAIIESVNSDNTIILTRGSLINYTPSHYDIVISEDISNNYEVKFPLNTYTHYYGSLFYITPNFGTIRIYHNLGYYYTNKLYVHTLLKISFDLERDIEVNPSEGCSSLIGREYLADQWITGGSASININLSRSWNGEIIQFPYFSVPIEPYPLCDYKKEGLEIIIGDFIYSYYTQNTFYLQLTYDHENWQHSGDPGCFNRVIRIKNLKVSVLLPTFDGEFEEMEVGETLSLLAVGGTYPDKYTAVDDLLFHN